MNVAIALSGVIVNELMTVFSTSIGGIAVWVVKCYFFQYYKKAKRYGSWGPLVKYEYIDFGKRK
ncbi:hypothetical protein ACIQXW_07725 [Lysinibacillus sp. NPDC097162]|uniref:hypothetical protein n=1 Tax=Lysinibacillus sp. NPDC097162 TaxID=3364140 RepID=UPI0037FD6C9E